MTSQEIVVSFDCGNCGERLVWGSDFVDDSDIVCKKCGHHAGTYADIRARAIDKVRDAARESIRRAVKDALHGR